ncbi:hypothetical protein E1286_37340 [Nonomuraea terrae]|uniref:Uncharacterized protein n=1 Tax=Nonomuraea terrae TaxID=2530383 RepID=A0A4R4Y028_9ACTN|nr:hypothetical protein [Nonomuraea terrae]TDD37345.1 hypothetical protein E1286_37340 [Nonomuraea terrae]
METADVQARLRRPRLLRDAVRESGRHPARLATHAAMVLAAALRAAVRRSSALLPLAMAGLVTAALIAAAGLGVARLSGRLWPAIVITAVPALVVLPALLAVPAVVLERRTAWNALHPARLLLSENRWRGTFTLTVGAAVVPAAAALSLYGLVDLLPTSLAPVVIGIGGEPPARAPTATAEPITRCSDGAVLRSRWRGSHVIPGSHFCGADYDGTGRSGSSAVPMEALRREMRM